MNRRVRLANLLSGRGFVATAAFTLIFQLITEPAVLSLSPVLALVVLAFSQLGLYISLLGLQAFRRRAFRGLEQFAAGRVSWLRRRYDIFGMSLAGLIATLLAQSALNSLGHTAASDLLGALGGALVTHAVILPVLAIGLAHEKHHRQSLSELNRVWGQLELVMSRDLGPTMEPIEATLDAVASRVSDRLRSVKARSKSELSEITHQLALQSLQTVVRDLLSTETQATKVFSNRPQRIKLAKLLRAVDPWQLAKSPEWATMPALLLWPFYLELHGWLLGSLYFAVVALMSYVIARGMQSLEPRSLGLKREARFILAFACFAPLAAMATVVELSIRTQSAYTLAPQLLALIWIQQALAGIFAAAESEETRLDASIQGVKADLAWLMADVNTREWFVRKLFTRNQPTFAAGELVDQLAKAIALPPRATNLRHAVADALKASAAKASIDLSVTDDATNRIQRDPVATAAIAEVVRELALVALQLTKATEISTELLLPTQREVELILRVHQDGLGAQDHFDSEKLATPPRFLRECAYAYEYQADRTRAMLRVRIPIQQVTE